MSTPPAQRRNRNTELGDQACFCVSCGWARRFYPGVIEPPAECPSCAKRVVSSCSACGETIISIFAVDCDVCGANLRAPSVAGDLRIRRSPRRLPLVPTEPSGDGCGC